MEEVEEYRKSRKASKEQLYASTRDLFSGDALRVYNLFKQQALDWDGWVRLMKEEFVPDTEASWKQILSRTQGICETIGLYVATMSSLFDRMPTLVPDVLRMQVLMRNILPFLQERLTLVEVKTPFELIEPCREIEQTRANIESYKPPRVGDLSLEPDLSFGNPCGSSSKYKLMRLQQMKLGAGGVINSVMWSRIAVGLSMISSVLKVGFTKRTCPNCQPRQPGNISNTPSSSKSGNASERR